MRCTSTNQRLRKKSVSLKSPTSETWKQGALLEVIRASGKVGEKKRRKKERTKDRRKRKTERNKEKRKGY